MNHMPVSIIPSIGPEYGRVELEFPEGLNVAEIVDLALPAVSEDVVGRSRVWLVNDRGETLLPTRSDWRLIKPRPGVRVMIRMVAGENALKNVLLIAVSIAAVAIGQTWIAPLLGGGVLGQIGASVAAGVIAAAGSFLINKLFPTPVAGNGLQSEKPLYQISGWQNSMTPDGVVPSMLGRMRIAPVFAAPTYTEIIGDDQYVRALFTFGYGPIELSDLKIKDTPLDKFTDVDTEIRNGYASDEPVTLYPRQVIEDSLGVELRRDRLRDSAGTITGTGPITPTTRFSASDATQGSLIFHFPGGLINFTGSGNPKTQKVSVRVRQRPASGGAWQTVKTITFSGKRREGFFRQYKWTFPSRGRWEIELARTTHEATEANVSDRVTWLAMQSFRPEYP